MSSFPLCPRIFDELAQVPDPPKDKNILVYYKRKKSGNYDDKDYFPWERRFMDKMVNAEYVHKNQKRIIMDLDFFQFGELIDIRPQRGSPFIHSMSEPFSEEDIEDDVLHNWLDHFGMQFHQLHASGHLNREQIGQVINDINAKKVFPVHTENAPLFKKISKRVRLPELGKENQV